jgi:glycosyltransferase involved in cell wall biosynthesis
LYAGISTETFGSSVFVIVAIRLSSRPHHKVRRVRADQSMPGRLMMTAFGWKDPGGGTTVPRLAARELARRGWDVTVFHASTQGTPSHVPYELSEWEEDGVRLIGVHNRAHLLFDIGHPLRELDDAPITAAFAAALDRLAPEVVHFHNLHNLGAALIDQAAVRGLPAYFTTHNYWLICPRVYLLTGAGAICPGPGDGGRCAACVGSPEVNSHERRLGEIRARAHTGLTKVLAVSDAVREALLGAGYDPALVDVVRQAMPHEQEIWESVGRDRQPGRVRERMTVAFLGSAYPHKGPQLLVDAAQRTEAQIDVRIIGEISEQFSQRLRALDRRGVVTLGGAFAPDQIGRLLSDVDVAVLPSMWWDCAPLAAAECLAARTPLVVPRLGGLPESIREGVDGLSFAGLDAGDLARVLDRLATEPGLLERLQAGIEPPRAFSAYVDELEAYYGGAATAGREAADPIAANAGRAAATTVRWQGNHGLPTSLSIINDRVSERIEAPLQRVQADGSPLEPPLPHPAAVEVRQQWPPELAPPGSGRLAAIVPWEFGSAPRDWVAQIGRNVDELWVPSEYVRGMYVGDGVPAERGDDPGPTRFLFVGGLVWRKGPDLLLEAYRRAFPGRDDVELVMKDFGADSIYRGGDREAYRQHADSGALPRLTLLGGEISTEELADLYRSCDVFVHPYRGEGFNMPVLEAMACGLPVITTAGGPTDEFCPPEAGWRVRSRRIAISTDMLGPFTPASEPWMLEPELDQLVELMRAAAADPAERRARGRAARAAAEALSWDAVAARYSERIAALVSLRPKLGRGELDPFPLSEDARVRVLAVPAWRGSDQLAELLRGWGEHTTRESSACLYLLADPALAGQPEEIESRVVEAAQRGGLDLDNCADVNVLMEPLQADRDARLHLAMTAFVPLHAASAGHIRLARSAANRVVAPGSGELGELLVTGS